MLRKALPAAILAAITTLAGTSAGAQSYLDSTFFYQGVLTFEGERVDSDHDFRFTLWSDAIAGTQIGNAVEQTLQLTEGVFSSEMDFGSDDFRGLNRWLQIEVRPAGSGDAFVTLGQRQRVAATPYAVSAGSLHPQSNGNIVINDPTGQPVEIRVGNGGLCLDSDGDCSSPGPGGLRVGTTGIHGADSSDQNLILAPTSGNVVIGGTTPINPFAWSKVLNVQGSTSAALVLSAANGNAANDQWSFGMLNTGDLQIRHDGDASGIVQVPILQITRGADIAEPFTVNGVDEVTPGMLVSIDPENPGEMRLAVTAYDPQVAGVISGAGGVNPGLMLTQEGSIADGDRPVAMTGRVYAWVDADANGPIQPGDLLTTSNNPGHAMKATDRDLAFGTVVGKAMTSLDSGQGLVLMLVRPQ